MTRSETFNFSAGPSVLPEEVLRQAQAELLNYHGTGMSVMEMSHRSQAFSDIFQDVKARFALHCLCRTHMRSCFCRAAARRSFP